MSVRILVCHNYYSTRGGEGHVVDEEIRMLKKQGHDVIPCFRDSNVIRTLPWWKKVFSFFFSFHNPRAVRELKHIIDRYSPDVAHIHNVFPLLSPAVYRTLYKEGVPVVQTLHNFRFLCINGLLHHQGKPCGGRGFPLQCIGRRCLHDSLLYSLWYTILIGYHRWRGTFTHCIDRYIALNAFTKQVFVSAGFSDSKIMVKPNSVTVEDFSFVESPRHYAVYSGRLSQEKGILPLLRASLRVPSLPLHIVGDGPLEKDMHHFIATHNATHITMHGRLAFEECTKMLQHARVTVCPSICYENCPLSVINGVYLGVPVIASDTGGLPDFVPEGRAGWLVPPGDEAALAERLHTVALYPETADTLRRKARAFGQAHFSSERNYKALLSAYDDAIEARKMS